MRGIQLAKDSNWDAALAEFNASIEALPNRNAMANAAICLRQLKRYSEAYAMYADLLQRFGATISPDEKAAADSALGELRSDIGEIDVDSTPTGATVVIDGQPHGATPLPSAVVVNAGTHSVRVSKDGFNMFESQVLVAGKQRRAVSATLKPLSRSGTLLVQEQDGRALSVLIDGAAVGKTPWQGALGLGQHSVALRGEGDLGTAPSSATVRESQTTTLVLHAEPLDAELRIEPLPSNANVFIDGVSIGNGVWQGRVKSSAHTIEIAADGHVPYRKVIVTARGQQRVLRVSLERDLSNPMWHAGFASHPYLELVGGLAVTPSLGGAAQKACNSTVTSPTGPVGGCASSSAPPGFLVGARGGFEFAKGLGVELFAGYFSLSASEKRRVVASGEQQVGTLYSDNLADTTSVNAPTAAVSASYRLLDKTPITLRLWAGATRATIRTTNAGDFVGTYTSAASGMTAAASGPIAAHVSVPEVTQNIWIPIVGPEARFGYRFSKRFSADLGVAVLWAFPGSNPRTGNNSLGNGANGAGHRSAVLPTVTLNDAANTTKSGGLITLPLKEDAVGTFFTIAPTLAARLDF